MPQPRHAFVVGGTRGIGRAYVRQASAQGLLVSVLGRRPPAEEDKGLDGVRHWVADLRDAEGLRSVMKEILARGDFDHVVFLQRFRGPGDDWEGELQVSLTATKAIIEAVAPHFAPDGGRAIVLGSSVASELVAEGQPLSYHVGKAALEQMVRYYAVHLGPQGIRVNGVAPCTVLKAESREFYLQNQPLHDLYKSITPLRRMGTTEDVSNVIAFLSSPGAGFVNGQVVVVDGGMTLLLHDNLARRIANVK